MDLIIRTDASTQIGIGHMMRCLALAQAWQGAGGHSIFVMGMEAPALKARLKSEGMDVVYLSAQTGSADDALRTADLAKKMGANWIVVDGYHFDSTYQRQIKDSDHQLMVVDDMAHLDHYYADIVLNQNIHAQSLKYPCEPYTKLLLGVRYVLLRREFLKWRGWSRQIPDVASKVLVTLGGSDPNNVTLKVIQAFRKIDIPGLEVKIIVGPSNPHFHELQSEIRNLGSKMEILQNVNNMPEWVDWADVAVSAGGSTCWELAFMGVPNFIIILTDNQRPIAEQLRNKGAAFNLGWYKNLSSEEITKTIMPLMSSKEPRERMALRGPELVDGEGAERVLMYVKDERMRLRKARGEDCGLIWEWSNDPEVRTVSFLSNPILCEQHVKWFESKLDNPDCMFYIAVNHDDIPIGQVRYDIEDREAVISISIDQKFRGRGYGVKLIQLSSKRLFGSSNVTMIHAYVKPSNDKSAHTFLEAGFEMKGTTKVQDHPAVHLIFQKCDLT